MFHVKHHTVDVRHVSRETYEKACRRVGGSEEIQSYVKLLFEENQKVNLISRKMPEEIFKEHLVHCVLVESLGLLNSDSLYVDAGTGGGLPGLPLALLLPQSYFVLNDKSVKKQISLQRMVSKLAVGNVRCHQGDIASLRVENSVVILSKHAFKIPDLLRHTVMLTKQRMVFWKGEDFFEELRMVEKPKLRVIAYDLSGLGEFYQGKYILDIEIQ